MTPDVVDEWGEESFPASDPASGWQGPEEPAPNVERLTEVVDGHTAFLAYERTDDGRLVLLHTEVPEAVGGRGVGGDLVRRAVNLAVQEGRTLVPRCPFARHWLSRNHDQRDRVAIDWHLGHPRT